MKKQMLFVLTALLCYLTVTGCAADQSEIIAAETTAASVETEAVLSAAENIRSQYKNIDMEGAIFNILGLDQNSHWIYSNSFNEVFTQEQNGEVINDAIYTRNLQTSELLNITLTAVLDSVSTVQNNVAKSVAAGDNTYNAVLNTMTNQASHALAGYYINFYSIQTMNPENPWWDENLVNTFTYQKKLYWITGDINVGDDYAVEVLFFNKNMCDDFNFDYPYKMIQSGTWTFDVLYEMGMTVKNDINGDGQIDINDKWGLIECNDHIKHWLYPLGEKSIEITSDGTLRIAFLDESHINAVNTIFNYFVDGGLVYLGNVNNDNTVFTEGRALFFGNQLFTLNGLREMEDEFGIVPMPKLNPEQINYGAYISNGGATAYSIPNTNTDLDNVGIVMESLCGFSTDTLRSALYDVLFSAKLVRDEESTAMLDIIFANKSYDWGVDFTWSAFGNIYVNVITKKANTYVSDATAAQEKIQQNIDTLTETLNNLS